MDSVKDHNFYLGKVWVQCENSSCLKWRLLRNDAAAHVDPNAPWYCYMNADPQFNNCSVLEEDFPEESRFRKNGLKYIYSKLPLGSLVLAKMQTWPRWPGILCPDPVNGEYVTYDLDGNVESHHVEFLGKPHSRQWVLIKFIGYYPSLFKEGILITTLHHFLIQRIDLMLKSNEADACKRKKGWYRSALEEADKLLACSAQQRLEKCYLSKMGAMKHESAKTKMDKTLCRKVIKAQAEVCEKKINYKIRRQKKKRILSCSLQNGASEDILSKENLALSETEMILKDLDQFLMHVADSSKSSFKSFVDGKDNSTRDEVADCRMELIEKRPMEINALEDCIIIDGKALKAGECIENITDRFKEIDSLMAEFQDSL